MLEPAQQLSVWPQRGAGSRQAKSPVQLWVMCGAVCCQLITGVRGLFLK